MYKAEHLTPSAANHSPLTPVDFLRRAVEVFPERPAVVWHGRSWNYAEFAAIVQRFAQFLSEQGVRPGDVVAVMASNRPEMLAAHYAVPMLGAILNTVNTRLNAETVEYILRHSEAKLLICDQGSQEIATGAAAHTHTPLQVLSDAQTDAGLYLLDGDVEIAPAFPFAITDEWQPICPNYTSGTTGNPKGVIYTHRGTYLNALGNVMALNLRPTSVYLWTLPMFHCNGWCHTWAVTAAGGLHVCLDRPDPKLIFEAITQNKVTHLSCAPVVLYMMLNHEARNDYQNTHRISVATGGAAPTSALIEQLDELGFDLIHLYGLTESFGPVTLRELTPAEAALSSDVRATKLAKQGVRHITASRVRIVDENGADTPADGTSIGEIVLSGNTIMAGYFRDAEATENAFAGGVFHTGDLAVRHPDGNIEIRDRSKDLIISGGENISSLEIESVLHRHAAVLLAAVVAAPHEKWGETPAAFVELRPGASVSAEELRGFCKGELAGFKVPSSFTFCELPKTSTGKIQKFVLRDLARDEDAQPRAGA